MALFGKGNKKDTDTKAGAATAEATDGWQPDKARTFFKHAKATQETGNYDYAMQLWLRGMAFDGTSVDALEQFTTAALSFVAENPKKSPSKETRQATAAKGNVGKYLDAVLAWALKPADAALAVRAADAATHAELGEPAYWLGERALRAIANDPKLKKDVAVKLLHAMSSIGAHDLAVRAGESAIKLDPSDGKLAAEVRNLSAQATMSSGGFEDQGQQGGFRKNVRDADKQALLEAGDAISKTDETKEKLLEVAKADYESRPDDIPATKTLIKRLLERGRPDDEKLAYKLAMKAYERHNQFTFRQQAGEIQLRVARRQLVAIRQQAEAGDADAQAKLSKAEAKFRDLEIQEYKSRVEAFPTDSGPKYELARRYFEAEDYNLAIPLLQKSQADNKYRARSLAMLGESFGKIGLVDPAIDTLRQALASHSDERDELGLKLRYALMDALVRKAEAESALTEAQEAERIASGIAMQQFDYADIQQRYTDAKALVTRLKAS